MINSNDQSQEVYTGKFEIRTYDPEKNHCFMVDPHDNFCKVVFSGNDAERFYSQILIDCNHVSMQFQPFVIQQDGIPVYHCINMEGYYDDALNYRDPPSP